MVEDHDCAGAVTATDPDGDAITFTRTGDPAHGQILSFAASGAFTYRPVANFTGADTFTVAADDGAGGTTAATVTINVASGDDDAPVLKADVIRATGSTPLVDVLANDIEPDGETLTLTLVGHPDFGSAVVENGKLRFTLPAGFRGFDRFQYRAVDGAGQGGTVNAVLFVDSEPVRVVYFKQSVRPGEFSGSELYIDDFVSTRKVTSFETSYPVDGLGLWRFTHGDDGRSLVLQLRDGNGNEIRALDVVPIDGSFPQRRITPPVAAGVSYEIMSGISHDGRWLIYRQMRSGSANRYFLADLSQNGTATEIPLPAGASSIEDNEMIFAPDSQSFIASIDFPFLNSSGSALYRYAVPDMTTPQLASVAARADVDAGPPLISADGTRFLYEESPSFSYPTALKAGPLSNPASVVTISHALGPQEYIVSYIRTDAAFSKVYYVVQSGPPNNNAFDLYVADAAVANSGAHLASLPTNQQFPDLWWLSPDETRILFTAPQMNQFGFFRELREIALTPGATSNTLLPHITYVDGYQYVDQGRWVVYADNSSVLRVPTTGAPTPVPVLSPANCGFDTSADATIVASCYHPPNQSPATNYLWLANTTPAGPFTLQAQFTGIDDPQTWMSTWAIVPAP